MKVLFAVNDENISTSIVKKYQKKYKEIISYNYKGIRIMIEL